MGGAWFFRNGILLAVEAWAATGFSSPQNLKARVSWERQTLKMWNVREVEHSLTFGVLARFQSKQDL
jgi:hypothetical protein